MSSAAPLLELSGKGVSLPFEIHTMEWIQANRWQQHAVPHRHSYFVIVWVKKANGIHLIDLEKWELQPDTVYCIAPGQVHHLQTQGTPEGYVISFTEEFLGFSEEHFELLHGNGLFKPFTGSPLVKVQDDMREDMEDMARKMIKEYGNFFLLRSEILKGYLRIFLIYLGRQFRQLNREAGHSRSIELVKQFIDLVEKKYTTQHMVADYAEALVVTPNHLNEIVKKITGYPASHHIQQRIVLEAKRYAAYSPLTMKEVAWQLGFEDISHFSKFFSKAAGKSFTDFRKHLQLPSGG